MIGTPGRASASGRSAGKWPTASNNKKYGEARYIARQIEQNIGQNYPALAGAIKHAFDFAESEAESEQASGTGAGEDENANTNKGAL
jgi:hypothetical protein